MPPASNNESQGLKIAVATFVALSVILAVSCYFAYSSYEKSEAALAKARSDESSAKKATADAYQQWQELRDKLGYRAIEDHQALLAQIKKDEDAIRSQIGEVITETNAAVAAAKAGGEANPKFDELAATAQSLSAPFKDPNQPLVYKDAMATLASMLRNVTSLSNTYALNDVELRRRLVSQDKVNEERLKVATDASDKSKADLNAEHEEHERQRSKLNSEVDSFQTKVAQQAAELSNLKSSTDQDSEKQKTAMSRLNQINRTLRAAADQKETVMDRPDGKVLAVDYSRNEVRLDVNRRMGAKPQMKLAIFDKSSPGVPTERPKARIELIQVGDRDSIARIEKGSTVAGSPIRAGDFVHSVAWSPNEPMKFALIGKLDINRDGVDDRGDLIRLIEAAGGVIEYDLPSPDSDPTPGQKAVSKTFASQGRGNPPRQGRGIGELNSTLTWYVFDDRGAFYRNQHVGEIESSDAAAFREESSKAQAEARSAGIRPIGIDRLLAYLGYNSFQAVPATGRPEFTNKAAIRQLTTPKPAAPKAATPDAIPDAMPAEPPK